MPKVKSLKAAALFAVNVAISPESFTIGGGLGYGLKIPVINTELIQSISLTDAEVNKVQGIAGVFNELNAEWRIKNVRPMRDENGIVTSYISDLYTKNKEGTEVSTGISVFSGSINQEIDNNGVKQVVSQSDNVWRSENYQNEAVDAERYGGTVK